MDKLEARPSALYSATAERPEFAPPQEEQIWRGLALALLAHVLLFVALTFGLHWQRESENAAVEAELWSSLPQEAAPKPVPAPPPPPPAPAPVVKPQPAPEPPVKKDADIAIEREKQRRELEKQREAELERERLAQQRKLEAQKKHDDELAKKRQEQQLQAKLLEQEKRKQEEIKRKELQAKAAQEAKLREQARQDQIRRSLAMAAGTGSPSATGSAAHSSGPSASWGAKVQARVRPNIVFTDAVSGNPKAEVEVRCSPDGTIVGKRLVHSSGNKSWDDAVLRALDRTESLPRDIDGRVPSPVIIAFRPHD